MKILKIISYLVTLLGSIERKKRQHFRKDFSFDGKDKIRYLIIDDTISSGGTARRIMENISLYSDKQATCVGILLYEYYTCRRKLEYQKIYVPVIGAEHYDGHTCDITIS